MELNQQQLEALKERELEIFRSFLEVCGKRNLQYYLLGGTLLGAVRHQGFIPWDDDIDVGMPREDYEKFLAQAPALLPEHLFVQTHASDPEYPNNFAKIRDSRTTFVENSYVALNMHHGVFIDIFPLDYYPDKGEKWFSFRKELLRMRIREAYTLENDHFLAKVLTACARLVVPTVAKAVEKREALFRSVTMGSRIANHCGAWKEKEIVPAHWYGAGTELTFEGLTVLGPAHYEQWLTQVYGDYMQLPPPEKRVGHHVVRAFDLNKSYLERN